MNMFALIITSLTEQWMHNMYSHNLFSIHSYMVLQGAHFILYHGPNIICKTIEMTILCTFSPQHTHHRKEYANKINDIKHKKP